MKVKNNLVVEGYLSPFGYTTAQLATITAAEGSLAYNRTEGVYQFYDAANWVNLDTVGSSVVVLDEDDFASDSDTAAPSQQSAKAYVDTSIQTAKDEILGGAGAAYDTLLELQNELQSNDNDITTLLSEIANNDTDIASLTTDVNQLLGISHEALTIRTDTSSILSLTDQELSIKPLTLNYNITSRSIVSDYGNNIQLPLADSTNDGLLSTADFSKIQAAENSRHLPLTIGTDPAGL